MLTLAVKPPAQVSGVIVTAQAAADDAVVVVGAEVVVVGAAVVVVGAAVVVVGAAVVVVGAAVVVVVVVVGAHC